MSNTDTGFSFVKNCTVTFEEERAIWLKLVPELASLFVAMPERKGMITVYTSTVPPCPGAIILSAAVIDKHDGGPEWWWCQSECLQAPKGDLEQRLRHAGAEIDGMRARRAEVTRPRPARRGGSNVVPFEWYKQLFETEGV
jgi:hypothetical protein